MRCGNNSVETILGAKFAWENTNEWEKRTHEMAAPNNSWLLDDGKNKLKMQFN